MGVAKISEGEIKIRAPISLKKQLKDEADKKKKVVSVLIREKLETQSEPKELVTALDKFFKLFQSLVKDERINLNSEDRKILKEIQEVAKKHV